MISNDLLLLFNLAKVQSLMSKKFASLSVHGLGFSDFLILYLLNNAADNSMRRIDLADKMGLTASGVTRLLNPMEKTGLVGRDVNERDARVSYVIITDTGKRIFEDAVITAESIAKELFPAKKNKSFQALSDLLFQLGGNIQ